MEYYVIYRRASHAGALHPLNFARINIMLGLTLKKKLCLQSPKRPKKNAPTPKNVLAIKRKHFFISSVKIQFLYFIYISLQKGLSLYSEYSLVKERKMN